MRRFLPWGLLALLLVTSGLVATLSAMSGTRSTALLTANALQSLTLGPGDLPAGWQPVNPNPSGNDSLGGLPLCRRATALEDGSPSITRAWSYRGGRSSVMAVEIVGATRATSAPSVRKNRRAAAVLDRRCFAQFNRQHRQPSSCTSRRSGSEIEVSCGSEVTVGLKLVSRGHPAPRVESQGLVDSIRVRTYGMVSLSYTYLRQGVLATVSVVSFGRMPPGGLKFVRAAADHF